ncbi:MAG TPA: FxsA family protein [Stackebrandtia sp.]|uniref:FxsA family protein n=1 Tax=Stackebrandtia sp. TaxID=2023065 RepID=UPI002D4E2961|nr:FxsA family protein [Stackebrandtia sp.]HZE39954.1 FxsA family protein [Stackebrandtia sp.]
MTNTQPDSTQRPRVAYGARVAFAAYAAAELVVLYLLWTYIGIGWTLLLLAGTTAVGAILLGTIGTNAIREYRDTVKAGDPPGPAAISGVIGVVGAVLLILPGFLGDAVGLLCVFPPTRFLWRSLVTKFLHKRLDSPTLNRMFGPRVVHTTWGTPKPNAHVDPEAVIDGEVIDDAPKPRPGHEDGPREIIDPRDP